MGHPDGDGSWEHPWDLATALAQPAAVQPGTTIWLRGGTYTGSFISQLTGTSTAPLTLRAYPGEHVVLDSHSVDSDVALAVYGGWTTYWGFEVVNSYPQRQPDAVRALGLNIRAPHSKFINLIVHDTSASGIGLWSEAQDSEVYGCLIYNNGTDHFDHGIYVQSQTGTQRLYDNVIFDQAGYGLHAYGSAPGVLSGFDIEGNVIFNNGLAAEDSEILIGGEIPAARVILRNNYTYRPNFDSDNVRLNYGTVRNRDVAVENNYFVGGNPVLGLRAWEQVTLANNTFYGSGTLVDAPLPADLTLANYRWDNNTYRAASTMSPFNFRGQDLDFTNWQHVTSWDRNSQYTPRPPDQSQVVVRPNAYEPGRATIIVYNWDLRNIVDVNVSTVLQPGARYEIRNVQDYFGPPVASGMYDGTPIKIPMNRSGPPALIGGGLAQPPATGPEFNVFILSSTSL